MKKWEHRFEDISALVGSAGKEQHIASNKVRGLGEQGWELVSAFASRGEVWAAFKRPVEEAPEAGEKPSPAARRGLRGVQ